MNLILVAGVPASGKSRFAAYASEKLGYILLVKDELKERLFDTVGFDSHEGKRRLDAGATACMFYSAGRILGGGQSVILDNNFLARDRPAALALADQYGCQVVTVRFGGDVRVLFERYEQRDKDPSRHRGHAVSCRYPEVPGMERQEAAARETLAGFERKYRERGAFDFSVGDVVAVDTTDFAAVSHAAVLTRLKSLLK